MPSARVVIAAEGTGADFLRRQRLPANALLLPLQPAGRPPEVLASADVLVALLDADAGVFSVPSKVCTRCTRHRWRRSRALGMAPQVLPMG